MRYILPSTSSHGLYTHPPIDEAKPFCLRCRQSGYECDGYLKPSFVSENSKFSSPPRERPESPSRRLETLSPPQESTPTLICRSPSTLPTHDTICLSHMSTTLLPVSGNNDFPAWVGFRALSDDGGLAYQCLVSLAKVYFGRAQSAPNIATDGARAYGRSLSVLNTRLGDCRERQNSETLLSIAILTIYEVCQALSTPRGLSLILLACR